MDSFDAMRPDWSTLFLAIASIVIISLYQFAMADTFSREQLQLFLKEPGEALNSSTWARTYMDQSVQWEGTVYKVIRYEGAPTEVLIKIVDSSHMYDTVLSVPANESWIDELVEGQHIQFRGTLTGVVDNFLLKEALVDYAPSPSLAKEDKLKRKVVLLAN